MKIPGVAHEGEQAIQQLAGEGAPGWGSPMFGPEMSYGFGAFLEAQQMLVLGGADESGAVWSTVVDGPAGFAQPVDQRTIIIDALPAVADPLRDAFDEERALGILALQPETRRRIRINGTARRQGNRLVVRTEQVLGNCPKYLQTRVIRETAPGGGGEAVVGDELSSEQRSWIGTADTFFIASLSPRHGADSSHRGGMPGFITVESAKKISWPDYTGNQFYMTLGNMHLNPAAGLLFLDWENGHTLQLTGRGRVNWDPAEAQKYPGALRVVEFDIAKVVQIDHASRLRWELLDYSHVNPPARVAG